MMHVGSAFPDDRDAIGAVVQAMAKLIRERRCERGWTQVQLATHMSVTQSAVSRWERGKQVPVDLGQVLEVLGISRQTFEAVVKAALRDDEVERAIQQQALLSTESRQALLTIYRRLLVADMRDSGFSN